MKKLYFLLTALLLCLTASAADYVIFFQAPSNWDGWRDDQIINAHIYQSTSSGDTNITGDWPGKKMDRYYSHNSDKKDFYTYRLDFSTTLTPSYVMFNRVGGSGDKLDSQAFVNGGFYKGNSGTVSGLMTPTNLYIVGNVNGGSWSTPYSTAAEKSNNIYTFRKVTINNEDNGYGYFSFTTNNTTSYSSKTRYGAESNNKVISAGATDYNILPCPENVNASSANAFKMAAGTYDITVNLNTFKISVKTAASEPTLSLSLTTPSGDNLGIFDAKIPYSFTASNFASTPSVTVEYKQGTNGDYQTVGTFTATSKSDNISLTGLSANTPYTYYVKVSSGTYTDEKSVTFTTQQDPTPTAMYMYYSNGSSWNLPTQVEKATPQNQVFTWTHSFTDGEFAVFAKTLATSNDNDGWKSLETSRLDPANEVQISSSTNNTKTGVSGYTNKSFKITETGKYTVTMDYTNPNAVTVQFQIVKKDIPAPIISVGNATPNKDGGNVNYYIVTIDRNTDESGVRTYYTISGTDPTSQSNIYTRPIQVPAGHTVKAININDEGKSSITSQTVGGNTKFSYSWETANPDDRLFYLRVKIDVKTISGTVYMTADVNDPSKSVDYGTKNDSQYSWAKYYSVDESEQFLAANASNREFFENNSDHIDTPEEVVNGYTPNVQDNTTKTHVPRNFIDSYYRAYIHSSQLPAPVKPSNAPALRRATKAYANDESGWTTNDGTAAGNVDPSAPSRIAYTYFQSSNTTTGVEDVTTDRTDSDDANAPVYYYNLQGVRVANPATGQIYIRVQGNTSTKVLVK